MPNEWIIPNAMLLPLVVTRLLGMMLTAPVLSHEAFPLRLRALAAVVLSLPVMAQAAFVAVPASTAAYAAAVVLELLIGSAVGYAVRLVFAGMEVAAGYIGQQLGVGLIEAMNPTVDEAPGTVGRLMSLLAIVIFFAIGGHRLLIGGLMETFTAAPVMSMQAAESVLGVLAGLLAASFVLALKVASPVLAALLLATAGMAIVQRGTLSFNILTVGFPVYTLLGLVALGGAVAFAGPLLANALNAAMKAMGLWLRTV